MAGVSIDGIQIDWLDRALQKLYEDRECQLLFQKTANFQTCIKKAEAFFAAIDNLLKQTKDDKYEEGGSTSTKNYQIKII